MKKLPILLAITGGLLIAAVYILYARQPWSPPRVFLGVCFGFAIPLSWLKEPKRSLRSGIVVITMILLSLMILYTAWNDPVGKAVPVSLFCLAFGGIHFTMARLYQRENG